MTEYSQRVVERHWNYRIIEILHDGRLRVAVASPYWWYAVIALRQYKYMIMAGRHNMLVEIMRDKGELPYDHDNECGFCNG